MTVRAAVDPVDDDVLGRLRMQAAVGGRVDLTDVPPDVGRAVRVADRVGAPLLPVLDTAEAARRQQRRIRADVDAATAPARTVGLGLAVLPLLVVPAMARLLDLDLVTFYTGPVGVVVGVVALGFWGLGAATIVAMVRGVARDARPTGPGVRVLLAGAIGWLLAGPALGLAAAVGARLSFRPAPPPPHADLAEACELLAAGMQAGLPAAAALREVAVDLPALTGSLRRLALLAELGRLDRHDAAPEALAPLTETLARAATTGGPVVPALRSLAQRLRDGRGAAAQQRAQRLPTHLVFPTALLLLPATVLLIGAPIVVTGLSVVDGT